jgi:hypothetical protein
MHSSRTKLTAPVRRRPATAIAIVLLASALGMIGFLLYTSLAPGGERLPNHPDDPWDIAAIVVSLFAIVSLSVVGVILAIRRPHNPIGWLLLASGIGIISGDFIPAYVDRSVILGDELPGYRVADWLGYSIQYVGLGLLAIWIPLLFPTGRLPSPRWRPIAWLAALAMGMAFVALAVTETDSGRRLPNPVSLAPSLAGIAADMVDVSNLLTAGLIATAAVSVVVRFRRSRGIEREQLKWFLAAIGLLAVAMIALVVTLESWAWFALLGAFAALPIAIGVAVLRYRLYEIDRLISRTISWAAVTGVLLAAFTVLVLALTRVLEPLTGGNTLAVAGSTLVVVTLFAPVRRSVQQAVDHRFDRSRYDGERLLAVFGERLRDEVDLQTIQLEVLTAVDAGVRPSNASLWLRHRA